VKLILEQKVKGEGHWDRKCKHRAYLREKWIDYIKLTSK